MFRAVEEVGEIKVGNVVANYDIWIHLLQEFRPLQQHRLFILKLKDLSVDDRGAVVECKDISHKWLLVSVPSHHGCDLNNGILVCLWEDTLSSSTLDIKRQYSQRRNFGKFSLHIMCNQVPVMTKSLNLAC